MHNKLIPQKKRQFRKRIALQGGVAATVTPVALLCATKELTQREREKAMQKLEIPRKNVTVAVIYHPG